MIPTLAESVMMRGRSAPAARGAVRPRAGRRRAPSPWAPRAWPPPRSRGTRRRAPPRTGPSPRCPGGRASGSSQSRLAHDLFGGGEGIGLARGQAVQDPLAVARAQGPLFEPPHDARAQRLLELLAQVRALLAGHEPALVRPRAEGIDGG